MQGPEQWHWAQGGGKVTLEVWRLSPEQGDRWRRCCLVACEPREVQARRFGGESEWLLSSSYMAQLRLPQQPGVSWEVEGAGSPRCGTVRLW